MRQALLAVLSFSANSEAFFEAQGDVGGTTLANGLDLFLAGVHARFVHLGEVKANLRVVIEEHQGESVFWLQRMQDSPDPVLRHVQQTQASTFSAGNLRLQSHGARDVQHADDVHWVSATHGLVRCLQSNQDVDIFPVTRLQEDLKLRRCNGTRGRVFRSAHLDLLDPRRCLSRSPEAAMQPLPSSSRQSAEVAQELGFLLLHFSGHGLI
mmetsp:Transcript_52217/g.124988  ORF Transcript_52217/g.124988 Transcript_52217/m.124988 type:complete len:210 (-) Transcript_52217:15-644(-)